MYFILCRTSDSQLNNFVPQGHLAISGNIFAFAVKGGGFVPGLWWVEGNDAVNDPMVNRTALQQRLIWSKMSVVPLLRNPILFLNFSGLP